MRGLVLAALAAASAPASAQAANDPLLHPAIAGRWTYGQVAGGSEATFSDASGARQLVVRCVRATRQIRFVRPAMAAAPALYVWTSTAARQLPATFDAATAELRADVAAVDRLLDALAFSKGRFAVAVAGAAPVIVPNWPEPTRAIEDCRN